MDKRLASGRVGLQPHEWFASFAMHCDERAKRRSKDEVYREELQALLREGFDAMCSTLGVM
jgi:hypothetical protein